MTRSRQLGIAAAWVAAFWFVNTINATSVLMERARQGPPVATWEPFTWEYTSGIAFLVLIPLVLALDRRLPFRERRWQLPALLHAAATVPFSLAHVAMMVGMREVVYALFGSQYDFGNVPVELLYEYRKDVITYALVLGVFYAWRLYSSRHRGATYDEPDDSALPRFLVRNRGRVVRLAGAEIDWVEAAGNYVLLHVGNNTHPLRETMKDIEDRLGDDFCRVHRSTLVNLARVERTLPAPGGALYLRLADGTDLKCSRSLRAAFAERYERHASRAAGSVLPA